MQAGLVTCRHCGRRNRVAASGRGLPDCRSCHDPLPWITEAGDDNFTEIAEGADVPVLVDMWAPWCAPCVAASPGLERIARHLAGRLKLVTVNVHRAPRLRQRFTVEAVPTLMVLRGPQIIAYQGGGPPEPSLRAWLDQALSRHQPLRRGRVMKSDEEIREDVIRELRWDPQVSDPEAIGVAVKDGAVTLTGHAPTYGEKLAAARAAARVYGVKAIADDIKVRLKGDPRDDQDIAQAIAHVLENNTQIPEGRVHARVQGGWVTLDGEVDYEYQRHEVERMVRHVRGVIGVTNTIRVSPPASNVEVLEEIEQAFRREAEVDPRHIRVEVTDHTARLFGHVHSLTEATAATEAAASAPGVAKVESHLVVSP